MQPMNYHQQYMQHHLRAVQLKELDILKEIRTLCDRHHIPYWLDGGTLLGAVRHGGFIPWDDDIDIAMRKNDLPHFLQVAREELPPHFYVQTPHQGSSHLPMVKIRDTRTFLIEPGDDLRQPYPKSLYVDIFPLQPYPNVTPAFCRHILKPYCKANNILHTPHHYSWRALAELLWFGTVRTCCRLVWTLAQLLLPHDQHTANVIETNGYGIIHRNSHIYPLSTIAFEGETFSAPADPHAYLTNIYGDYTQLPPPEKRTTHALFYHESPCSPLCL